MSEFPSASYMSYSNLEEKSLTDGWGSRVCAGHQDPTVTKSELAIIQKEFSARRVYQLGFSRGMESERGRERGRDMKGKRETFI